MFHSIEPPCFCARMRIVEDWLEVYSFDYFAIGRKRDEPLHLSAIPQTRYHLMWGEENLDNYLG